MGKIRILAGFILIPSLGWAQHAAPPNPSSAAAVNDRPSTAVKSASQILDENRSSVAELVAAGNTSVKLGTGFFVRSTGLLLTNFHVVEGTEQVGVKTPGIDGVLWAKKATGFDLDNDLVLLEVETKEAKPVSLGDSDKARVGEQIVVVGNPDGLEQTVSNGLVSGIRELDGRRLFQISAPISEGSSGSPVFNSRGEVIAVVVSSLEFGQNLNFAVPINYLNPLLGRAHEQEISALPKRSLGEAQPGSDGASDPDPIKLAVQAMRGIADEIRACEGINKIVPVNKGKRTEYAHFHSDQATNVRFDVTRSGNDSLAFPFEGIIEFSVHFVGSRDMPTAAEAASAADYPTASRTISFRYFYRINGSEVQLDYQTYFDQQSGTWIVNESKKDSCWNRIVNQ